MKVCIVCIVCIVLTVSMLSGCQRRDERVVEYREVTNMRKMSGNYIHYEIENGKVTCREHTRRDELACWNKVKVSEGNKKDVEKSQQVIYPQDLIDDPDKFGGNGCSHETFH